MTSMTKAGSTVTAASSPTVVQPVTAGIDTHGQTHHAAVIDALGRPVADRQFAATLSGYRQLLAWLLGFGEVAAVGIEGSGCYGVALAAHLRGHGGLRLVEVDRPNRQVRRRQGKSDPLDAYAAARAVQAGTATGVPKTHDGQVEAIRTLRVARLSAVKARTQAMNQLRAVLITCPAELREQLRGLSARALVTACAALRPGLTGAELATSSQPVAVLAASKATLRRLARRHQQLTAEIADTDADLTPLVQARAPRLLALPGVGTEVAAQLLTTAGDNPDRLHSDAAFARLCGVAPLPASSGRTDRHRLNRGGDRAANNALWRVVLVRMATDQRTRAYLARRTTQGLSKKEIMRCLKRYVARETLTAIRLDSQ
jgi:transposase